MKPTMEEYLREKRLTDSTQAVYLSAMRAYMRTEGWEDFQSIDVHVQDYSVSSRGTRRSAINKLKEYMDLWGVPELKRSRRGPKGKVREVTPFVSWLLEHRAVSSATAFRYDKAVQKVIGSMTVHRTEAQAWADYQAEGNTVADAAKNAWESFQAFGKQMPPDLALRLPKLKKALGLKNLHDLAWYHIEWNKKYARACMDLPIRPPRGKTAHGIPLKGEAYATLLALRDWAAPMMPTQYVVPLHRGSEDRMSPGELDRYIKQQVMRAAAGTYEEGWGGDDFEVTYSIESLEEKQKQIREKREAAQKIEALTRAEERQARRAELQAEIDALDAGESTSWV
jgi:hypothetical protein